MKFQLSQEERESLRHIQRKVSGTTANVRVTSVLMFNHGRSVDSISEDLGISVATVYRYIGLYVSGGIDKLLRCEQVGYWGKMDRFSVIPTTQGTENKALY